LQLNAIKTTVFDKKSISSEMLKIEITYSKKQKNFI